MQSTSVKSRPALNQGILFGIIVGVILAVYLLISYIVYIPALTLILGIVTFLIELGLYAFAGYRASAITGKTSTGAVAGLFTGLIGGLIGAVVSIILLFVYLDISRTRLLSLATTTVARQLYTNSFIITTGLIGALVGLGLAIGYGAGFGAIGGVIGKRRAPQAQMYQEAMYQSMPTQAPYIGAPPVQNPYSGVPPTQTPYQENPVQTPYSDVPPTPNPPSSNDYPANYQ